jgi:ribonucleoside-diphosphate reductase subunit M1
VNPPTKSPGFKADAEEGGSPKTLATEPGTMQDEELKDSSLSNAEEKPESGERENDIYADAVLACSIENPESCLMCSG